MDERKKPGPAKISVKHAVNTELRPTMRPGKRRPSESEISPSRIPRPRRKTQRETIEGIVAPTQIFQPSDVIDGQFEVLTLLGEGGMSQVYEARDLRLDRRVAVKVALPGGHTSLSREARSLARFRHPSLVTLHSMGEHVGLEYLVLERIFGVSLAKDLSGRKERQRPFGVRETLRIIELLAEGLAVVHRAGLVHRDVKPGNVMLTADERVVLMDFGLAATLHAEREAFVAGSPPYMAPESLAGTVQSGQEHLIDIFALGVMAFELLTLTRPFPGTEMVTVREAHRIAAPSLKAMRPNTPQALNDLIAQMLSIDPAQRPQTIEEVAWRAGSLRERAKERISHEFERPVAERVLVVEDSDTIAKVLGFYVTDTLPKADIIRARDGLEAIEQLRTRRFDLILLDLQMPKMNGIEFAMQARGERLLGRCRIIGVSAGAQSDDIQLLHEIGMQRFLRKDEALRKNLGETLRAMFGAPPPKE